MFSGPKLLLLGVVLWLVWFVFRLIERRNRALNTDQEEAAQQKTEEKKTDSFVELKECEGCGAYVATAGCDNPDCPVNS